MRKVKIAFMLVAAASMVAMAGCGGSSDSSTTVQPTDDTGSAAVETTEQGTEQGADDSAAQTTTEPIEATLAETVIYDENGIKVTATGMEDSGYETDINVIIENTTDQDLMFTVGNFEINGYMMTSASLSSEVTGGNNANDVISFDDDELTEQGIGTVADMSFNLYIADNETWATLYTKDVTLPTSASGIYQQQYDDSGDVLLDENGIKVVCKGLEKDDFNPYLVFYVENNTDQPITVNGQDLSVNGYMDDDVFWLDLNPGAKGIGHLDFYNIEECVGITTAEEITSIEFNLYAIDEDWNELASTEEPITLNFD